MVILEENDKVALNLLQKYCFYRHWYNFLLVNFASASTNFHYGDINEDILIEISVIISNTLQYLKKWVDGNDITNIEFDDLSTIKAFNSSGQDRGALVVIKRLFAYADELQLVKDDTDECPKIEKLFHHIQRCILLIDLWYSGEDLTYFGTMLDLR